MQHKKILIKLLLQHVTELETVNKDMGREFSELLQRSDINKKTSDDEMFNHQTSDLQSRNMRQMDTINDYRKRLKNAGLLSVDE